MSQKPPADRDELAISHARHYTAPGVRVFYDRGRCLHFAVFFFNDTATTEIYTLSLHDALPIYREAADAYERFLRIAPRTDADRRARIRGRSEEHTSELQSHSDIVCRLLLE